MHRCLIDRDRDRDAFYAVQDHDSRKALIADKHIAPPSEDEMRQSLFTAVSKCLSGLLVSRNLNETVRWSADRD